MTDTTTTTLDELLKCLRADQDTDDDNDNEIVTGIDWTSLPAFGGAEPDDTYGVWSWDAERLIVGSGDDLRIVTRVEWADVVAHGERA